MPSCWASARVVTAGGGAGAGRRALTGGLVEAGGTGRASRGWALRTAPRRGEERKSALSEPRVSEVSSVTGVTMKRCPCRMARPSGPSTRRAPRATEARPPSWRVRPCLPSPDPPVSDAQRRPGPHSFTYV